MPVGVLAEELFGFVECGGVVEGFAGPTLIAEARGEVADEGGAGTVVDDPVAGDDAASHSFAVRSIQIKPRPKTSKLGPDFFNGPHTFGGTPLESQKTPGRGF